MEMAQRRSVHALHEENLGLTPGTTWHMVPPAPPGGGWGTGEAWDSEPLLQNR